MVLIEWLSWVFIIISVLISVKIGLYYFENEIKQISNTINKIKKESISYINM